MGIRIKVWGDYALFTRPELKVERYTYDVITPSAARGILTSIYWHPEIRWVIDRIYVMNPIKYMNIKRNELMRKMDPKRNEINAADEIAQRNSVILQDVCYVIDAHFELIVPPSKRVNPKKYYAIICKRLLSGRCYHTPYFGCREFAANFEICNEKEIHTAYDNVDSMDLGIMLYDIDFSEVDKKVENAQISPMFFRAKMEKGVIDLEKVRNECGVLK